MLDDVRLYAPSSWQELSQKQLRYVFHLMSTFKDLTTVKTYMFFRFCNLNVIERTKDGWKCTYISEENKRKVVFLQRWQVTDFINNFKYVDSYEGMGVRLENVQGLHAVDIHLHGIAFIDYLNAEKAYQGYMASKDIVPMRNLFHILYRAADGTSNSSVNPSPAEMVGTFMWYSYVKTVFNNAFPNFFRPMSVNENDEDFDIIKSINGQIRALTEGDITKEDIVLHKDCWRALTELDAKAREAAEMKRIMDKNNK